MKTYIGWTVRTTDGEYLDDVVLPVDTAAQMKRAEKALRDAGLSAAEVFAGEGADAVRTGHRVFGAANSSRDASHGQLVEVVR
jgi:hypothetical protein